MKKVFKRLEICEPKQQIGKERKKCKFKVCEVIIEMNDVSIVTEQPSFGVTNLEKDIEEWLNEHHLISVSIHTKYGLRIPNVLTPNLDFIKCRLEDVVLN